MRPQKVLVVLSLAALSTAQGDLFSSLLSDAQSIYTAVTSILASTASSTSTSSTATSTSSSSSSSTSTSSDSTTSSSQSASTTSTPAITSAPTDTAAAAQSSSAASNNGGGGSNVLPIVLGCTLGALAIAAFLALLLFCLRRRHRNKKFGKYRSGSPDSDEIESWRHEKPSARSSKNPVGSAYPVSGGAYDHSPLMTEHAGGSHHSQHQNPFVPIPPPARRTNLCAGLNSSTEYSAHPYSPEHVNAHEANQFGMGHYGHGSNHALAAGLGGAAVGGLAAHAHDRHQRNHPVGRGPNTMAERSEPAFSEDEHNTLPESVVHDRRSSSLGRANTKEPWPFMDAHERRSMDSSRSRARSLSRSHDGFTTPSQHPADVSTMPSTAGILGATAVGGLAGAAASRKKGTPSPHRKGILKQTTSDSSDPSSLSSEGAQPSYYPLTTELEGSKSGPHELGGSDIPPAPTARERRNSALGTAAPFAAAAAYHSRGRSNSPNVRSSRPTSTPNEDFKPPVIPSRSPKRSSLDSRARYSSTNEGTAEMPAKVPKQEMVSPPLEPQRSTEQDGLLSPISPLNGSENGSWSRAQAEQLGLATRNSAPNTVSQESTAVGTSPEADSSSDQHSSGLVSAIQKIFNSQKNSWADDEREISPVRERQDDGYGRVKERRMRNVPHGKPAANRSSEQYNSQYGDIARSSAEGMPGGWTQEHNPWNQPETRQSGESMRSMPPQYRSRGNSTGQTTSINDFAADTTPAALQPANTNRPRMNSRPGYGIGSGDPFDLARGRTDSSMTGISLVNYKEPTRASTANNRPALNKRESSSPEQVYHEPTLADLRREVMAEDRERAREAWRSSHSRERSNSAGLRYGNDRDMFNLLDQTTGNPRYYADHGEDQKKPLVGHVGRAY